jgi:alpha-beta hydrolase superfamily lysophospholipase
MWTEHRLISFDETPLFYRRFRPSGNPKAILLIVHGMGEHGGRYQVFAEYLGSFGIESAIPDLRGFGKSGGKRASARCFADFCGDLKAIHECIIRENKEIPLFLLGHSFGGLIASSYLVFHKTPKVKGLILSSPLFGIGLPVAFWRHWLGMLTSWFLPDYHQNTGVPMELLTHDAEAVRRYREDSLTDQRISSRLYRELVRMMARKKEIAEKLDLPVLIAQAEDDHIVSKTAVFQFYDCLKTQEKELEIYPGFYHEVLNELGKEKVFLRLANWILSKF